MINGKKEEDYINTAQHQTRLNRSPPMTVLATAENTTTKKEVEYLPALMRWGLASLVS